MILSIAFSIFILFLYLPSGRKIARVIESLVGKIRSLKAFNLVWFLVGLTIALITIVNPFPDTYSIRRLVPLAIWSFILFTSLSIFTIFPISIKRISVLPQKARVLISFLLLILFCFLFSYLIFNPVGEYFTGIAPRALLFLILVLLGTELLILAYPDIRSSLLFGTMASLHQRLWSSLRTPSLLPHIPFHWIGPKENGSWMHRWFSRVECTGFHIKSFGVNPRARFSNLRHTFLPRFHPLLPYAPGNPFCLSPFQHWLVSSS